MQTIDVEEICASIRDEFDSLKSPNTSVQWYFIILMFELNLYHRQTFAIPRKADTNAAVQQVFFMNFFGLKFRRIFEGVQNFNFNFSGYTTIAPLPVYLRNNISPARRSIAADHDDGNSDQLGEPSPRVLESDHPGAK